MNASTEPQPYLCSGECSDLSSDNVIVQILGCEETSIASNETACIEGGIFLMHTAEL